MVPGCAGAVVTVTLNVWAVPAPQALSAVTEISPSSAPAVAMIELVVELPVQSAGNVHVYEVAPVTGDIL